MQELDRIPKAIPESPRIDAADILKHLVRPLGYDGLTVMVFGFLGWRLLESDLPPLLQTLSLSLLVLIITYCFKSVNDKIRNAGELVLDGANHIQIAMLKSMQGTAMDDVLLDNAEDTKAAMKAALAAKDEKVKLNRKPERKRTAKGKAK